MASDKSRAELLSEKDERLRDTIQQKHGKTPEQLYKERDGRVRDTIALKEPDRVPVILRTGAFAARYAGLSASSMYYDHAAYREACRRMVLDFEPDLTQSGDAGSGETMELLDTRHQRWPGGNLPPDAAYQFVEGEYMKAEEYDLFLNDPSDFMLRFYLPRLYGVLSPLSRLPAFRTMGGGGVGGVVSLFASPEFRKLGEILSRAGQAQDRMRLVTRGAEEEINRLGFPTRISGGGVGGAPFDMIGDNLRGMRGAMLDMYRCPDKLLAACDKILEWRTSVAMPPNSMKQGKTRIAGRPLHKGAEGFMSVSQFEKFYWPTLKKAVLADIELGYIPWLVWQGKLDSRLEYFLEFPEGKVVCWFQDTDMGKAKAILANHICISGNVPASMLVCGSAQDVDDYCKKLIEVCGKRGGFILSAGSAEDDAKPENIKAMVDSVKKYGWY